MTLPPPAGGLSSREGEFNPEGPMRTFSGELPTLSGGPATGDEPPPHTSTAFTPDEVETIRRFIHDVSRDDWATAPALRSALPRIPIIETLPPAGVEYAYRMAVLQATPDLFYLCLRESSGTWVWRSFMHKFDFAGFFNGTTVEPIGVTVAESGGTVTMSLQQAGGGDLHLRFSDGITRLDTSPALTIALSVGSDSSPQSNYIYILQSAKVLTKSLTEFPSDVEHIKIAYFNVPSAALVNSDGIYVHQNWDDFGAGSNGQGHLTHITQAIRRRGAQWFSGVGAAGSSDYLTIAGSTVDLKSTIGIVYKLHRHAFPAFDTSAGDLVHVVNWNGDAYHATTNLFDIVTDSTGSSVVNRWFNITIWAAANEPGEPEAVFINLPSGSYPTQLNAEQDVDQFDNFGIPREFNLESGVGFLIARITIRATGSTWTYGSTTDLRGQTSASASGGVSPPLTRFADVDFEIHDDADETKEIGFSLGGITTGNKRILTPQDADGTLAYVGDTPTAHTHSHAAATGKGTDDHHNQAHTAGSHSDQGATGAELEELTDGSETTLHDHAGGGPTRVYKTAEETVTSSASLQNDNHLSFAVAANKVYAVKLVLLYRANTTPDIKLGWTVPSGATWGFWASHHGSGGGAFPTHWASVNAATFAAPGIDSPAIVGVIVAEGFIDTAGSSGTAQLQWAQNTSDGVGTVMHIGSYLEYEVVS